MLRQAAGRRRAAVLIGGVVLLVGLPEVLVRARAARLSTLLDQPGWAHVQHRPRTFPERLEAARRDGPLGYVTQEGSHCGLQVTRWGGLLWTLPRDIAVVCAAG